MKFKIRRRKHDLILVFFIFLIYFTYSPLFCSPEELNSSENLDFIKPSADPTEIVFSGYNWTVRTSNDLLQGPGPNYFNDSAENVWLDGNGYLHLKIIIRDGKWYCAEVYSELSFGYGTYVFTLAPGFENLDVNIVVGLFTYLDDENEIDIEFARWGQLGAQNGQYVVQASSNIGNLYRFNMPEPGEKSTHSFTWCEEYIRYWSVWRTDININSNNLITEWFYTGNDNPAPSTERVHINFWLMDGLAPTDSKEAEIVIEKFQFLTSACDDPIPLPSWVIWTLTVSGILGISITLVIILKKTKLR